MSKDPQRTVKTIEGTITMVDGTTRSFSISTDYGWSQWGEAPSLMVLTGVVVEALADGLKDAEIPFVSDHDEDDEYEPGDDEATYKIVRTYQNDREPKVIHSGMSLDEAREHCSDPKTKGRGWMDTFTREED